MCLGRAIPPPLNRLLRESLTKKEIFEQRPDCEDDVSYIGIWENSFPGRWNSQCRGPEETPAWVTQEQQQLAGWRERGEVTDEFREVVTGFHIT